MNETEKNQVLKFHQEITEYFMKGIPDEIEVNNLITYFNTKRLNTLVNDFLYDQENKKIFKKILNFLKMKILLLFIAILVAMNLLI